MARSRGTKRSAGLNVISRDTPVASYYPRSRRRRTTNPPPYRPHTLLLLLPPFSSPSPPLRLDSTEQTDNNADYQCIYGKRRGLLFHLPAKKHFPFRPDFCPNLPSSTFLVQRQLLDNFTCNEESSTQTEASKIRSMEGNVLGRGRNESREELARLKRSGDGAA